MNQWCSLLTLRCVALYIHTISKSYVLILTINYYQKVLSPYNTFLLVIRHLLYSYSLQTKRCHLQMVPFGLIYLKFSDVHCSCQKVLYCKFSNKSIVITTILISKSRMINHCIITPKINWHIQNIEH